MPTPGRAEPPVAPAVMFTVRSAAGAASTPAFTRTVCAPPSSRRAVMAAGERAPSVKLSATGIGSWMVISVPVTAAAAPPTKADPDTAAFSSPSASSWSSRAVSRKVWVPLICAAGMTTVKAPVWSVVKSAPGPATAPSAPAAPATLTVTSVSAARAEEAAPAKAAVTVIRLAVERSTIVSGLTDRTILSSLSVMVRSAPRTPYPASATVPVKRMVSPPSVAVSSATVMVRAGDSPLVSPALMITCAEFAEET